MRLSLTRRLLCLRWTTGGLIAFLISLLALLPLLVIHPTSLVKDFPKGCGVQRTMALLEASTEENRANVKILFYGQSITKQEWSSVVGERLRVRYPTANLTIENLAIRGFPTQLLVKTAHADVYPLYPDLVIFHAYGSHRDYETIVKEIRTRTTAEILVQTDHFSRDDDLDEYTNTWVVRFGEKIPGWNVHWKTWMNYSFLPTLAKYHGIGLIDVRNNWKEYLNNNNLKPSALLKDEVHLNERGCNVMANIVSSHLVYDQDHDLKTDFGTIEDHVLETSNESDRKSQSLCFRFDGNRVDLIMNQRDTIDLELRLDHAIPAEIPELYTFTRTSSLPGTDWPALLRIQSNSLLQIEDWDLVLSDINDDLSNFGFRLVGSKTGFDGSGEKTTRFVSNSGRVVIDPEDWNVDYARKVSQIKLHEGHQVSWKVQPLFFTGDGEGLVRPMRGEGSVIITLAQGLRTGFHELVLSGVANDETVILRTYKPPATKQ